MTNPRRRRKVRIYPQKKVERITTPKPLKVNQEIFVEKTPPVLDQVKKTSVHMDFTQKAHQEALLSNVNFDKRKQELQDETQSFMYAQSSKFSSVSRNLILGIIGTIWVLTYVNGNLKIYNYWLLGSLIVALLFLLVDVIHYYWDSLSYHNEQYKLDTYSCQKELENEHKPKMDTINKRSHNFIVIKFWILMLVSFLFAIGLIRKTFGFLETV